MSFVSPIKRLRGIPWCVAVTPRGSDICGSQLGDEALQTPFRRFYSDKSSDYPQTFSIATPRLDGLASVDSLVDAHRDGKASAAIITTPQSTTDSESIGWGSSRSSSGSRSPREATSPSNPNQVADLIMLWEAAEAVSKLPLAAPSRKCPPSIKRFPDLALEHAEAPESMPALEHVTPVETITPVQGTSPVDVLDTLRELRNARLKTAEALCMLSESSGPHSRLFASSLRDVNQAILCGLIEDAATSEDKDELSVCGREPLALFSAVESGLDFWEEPALVGHSSSSPSWEEPPTQLMTLEEFIADPVQSLEAFIRSQ